MADVSSLDEKFGWLDEVSFRFKPKGPDVVAFGMAIFRAYDDLSQEGRGRGRELVTEARSKKILAMSGVLADEAMNAGNDEGIKASVCMHALEDFKFDHRENCRYLILAYHAASFIGCDFVAVCSSLASLFSQEGRHSIQEFCDRDPSFNKLEAFGIQVIERDGRRLFAPLRYGD